MTAQAQYENLSLTVGRDYRVSSGYEFVVYADEETIVARKGFFKTAAQARKAGIKAAEPFQAASLF